MNKIILLLFVALVSACQTNDKNVAQVNSKTQKASSPDTLSSLSQQTYCKKCDTAIITNAAIHWNNLSNSLLESFLCSFDSKCKWEIKSKDGSWTYYNLAYETLIVELDSHLKTCVEIFDKNKDINFHYIMSLIKKAPLGDLPYSSIILQLEKKTTRTSTEQKLLDALKLAVKK